jgi:hypothetical protein
MAIYCVCVRVLRAVDQYGIISDEVPVAQWIEHQTPDLGAQVQFLSGTLIISLPFSLWIGKQISQRTQHPLDNFSFLHKTIVAFV